jgi:hypothetical protein
VQFTQVDYLRVLAEQDIAPYFRKRFLAIAFRTLPLRQLNAAAQQGRFDRNELIQRWQDIGFSATDASTMADTTLVQAARQSASLGHGYTPAVVSELAQEGLIDKATANARLAPQGFTPAQVDDLFEVSSLKFDLAQRKKYDLKSVNEYAILAVKAWEAGVVSRQNAHDALTRAGYSDASATLELDTANLRQRMLSIEGATKAIHKAFLYGEIAPTDAATALVLAGIIPPAEQTLVTRWQLEMTVARRFMSGSKIITWMKKGILSIANGQQRLLNLGYPVTEVMLAIAEAQQDIQRAQALAAQRNVKALAAAQKAAAAAISKTQKQFCKVYSPSRL